MASLSKETAAEPVEIQGCGHAQAGLGFTRSAQAELQVEWFTRLHTERANVRAALDSYLTEPAAALTGLRLAACLWFYWTACGFLREGRYWLDRALTLNPQPTPARAKGQWVDARMAIFQGDLTAAEQLLSQCRALASQLGDAHALAYGTQMLGVARLLSGDFEQAETLLQEAIAVHRANHELNSLTLLARIQLATAWVLQGNLERAVGLCEECRAISNDHGERWALSYALHTLALARWTQGEWDLAAAHELECLRLKKTFHDTVGMTLALELLAWITAEQSLGERTAVLLGAAQRSWQELGLPLFGSSYFMAHHETCEKQARRICGDNRFTTAFQCGCQLTLIEAADYASTGNPNPPDQPSGDPLIADR
jgi:tetratricopeptide (TPR) repeat protein